MSWGETKKINSDFSIPLNDLITEKTNTKIQTVTFAFGSSVSPGPVAPDTNTKTITPIDTNKSIIVPISYLNPPGLESLSYTLNTNSVTARRVQYPDGYTRTAFQITVLIITFGGEVV